MRNQLFRLNDKLAMYNSSHTSIIQRLEQLEKEKGAVTEIKQKFGGLEKSLAEKEVLIGSLQREKMSVNYSFKPNLSCYS